MTDLDRLTAFLRDLHALETMQPRYPLGTPIGDALAALIAEFSTKARTLNAFFEREPQPETPKPVPRVRKRGVGQT